MNDKQALFEALDYGRNPTWRRIFIFLALLPFGYIGLSALYLYLQWARIPDRFAVHFSLLSGQANGWAGRNFAGVYILLIVCFILHASMSIPLFFLILNNRFKSAGAPSDFPVLRARAKLLGIIFMLGIMHWMVLLMCYFSIVLPLAPQLMQKASYRWLDILLSGPLVALLFAPLYVWLNAKLPAGEDTAEKNAQVKEYLKPLKLGVFHWDPNDPSAIVPKRFGVGYTLNFATRLAWVYLAFILLPPTLLFAVLIIFYFVGKMR